MDHQLTKQEKDEIYRTFRLMDQNGDGNLSIYEIRRSAQILGCNPTLDDVKAIVKDVDKDGNAYISYKEYEEMMRQHLMALSYEREMLMRAFQKFDKDGGGYIEEHEIKRVLQHYGDDKLTDEEVTEFFKDFDSNNDGKICINEFIEAFCMDR